MRYLRPNVKPPAAGPPRRRPDKRSAVVRPLAPAVEEARRERARQHIREARIARGYVNYDRGPLDWKLGPHTHHED